MSHIHAPLPIPQSDRWKYKIFLAGSIEMGLAEVWQTSLIRDLEEFSDKVLFMNPRRPDWDSSWEQKKDNPQFREQVTWELDMLDEADMIIFYFDPNTKSPITLLELGLHASKKDIHLYCPEGYWRKGNVDIVCERHSIPVYDTKDEWINSLKQHLTYIQS